MDRAESHGSKRKRGRRKRPRKREVECFGGGKGIRTPGLLNAIEALSQLSYTPTGFGTRIPEAWQAVNGTQDQNGPIAVVVIRSSARIRKAISWT